MSQLTELLARVDAAKSTLDTMRPLDKEREARAMQKFRLWWTYHSNAIEGNSLSQGETEVFLMEGLTAKGKPLKDHLDLRGHNDAINFLLSFVAEKHPITEADIRGLHKILLVERYPVDALTPEGVPTKKMVAVGEYKTSPNHVRTRTGEIHYYATPEDTPAKMHELLNWYREETVKGEMHIVEIIARFHHRFTAIHPFDDGNGRMSRLLMNLMLMQPGYPPVVIRLSERDQYLAALRQADGGEPESFITLIGDHLAESLELFIRAAKGEEICEATDLRKEIRLEILRLKQNQEPEKRTRANLLTLYTRSIAPLIEGIASKLSDFCEVFSENSIYIQFSTSNGGPSINSSHQTAIAQPSLLPHISASFVNDFYITNSIVTFNLKGFRRGGYTTFDLSTTISVACEELKYTVVWNGHHELHPVVRFYQEMLTKDDIAFFSNKMARSFLEVIREKTNI